MDMTAREVNSVRSVPYCLSWNVVSVKSPDEPSMKEFIAVGMKMLASGSAHEATVSQHVGGKGKAGVGRASSMIISCRYRLMNEGASAKRAIICQWPSLHAGGRVEG